MPDPLVSIVMPVFNGMPYVQDAVRSALAQTYRNLEIHVLDNQSNDGTTEWLMSLEDPRVRVHIRDSTQPVGDNWTEVTGLATGEFTKLMCADDVLREAAIETQVKVLQARDYLALVASQRNVIDMDGKSLITNYGLGGLRGVVSGASVLRACLLAGTNLLGEPVSVLCRTRALKQAMPWRSEFGYLTDLATYAHVLNQAEAYFLPGAVGEFRISPTSWSSQLLQDQPKDFKRWQRSAIKEFDLTWTAKDRMRANTNLKVRTMVRKLFFKWVAFKVSLSRG